MPAVPGFSSNSLADVAFLVDGQLTVQAEDVLLASGQTSAITPTYRIPPGTVVGYDAGTSKWYLADDALVDAATAPAITSSGHTDGNGVITIVGNHGTISVTTTTGTGTEANNATDLNADATFAANYIATSGGGELTITALNLGAEEWFYVDTATMATAAFAEGQANEVQGTSADYRVTAYWADLEDIDGTAVDALAPALSRGKFRESVLSNLTAAAKAVLLARGSEFV